MRKQEEFGLILCKTVQNQPRSWFYPKMNLSTVDTRSRNSVSSYAKLAVKLHFNCPKGRRKVIARRVILMVKHFFFKKHLLSHVNRYIKSTQIFTSYRWTTGVENENSEEYFCFEEKHDEMRIIEWQCLYLKPPWRNGLACWTSNSKVVGSSPTGGGLPFIFPWK